MTTDRTSVIVLGHSRQLQRPFHTVGAPDADADIESLSATLAARRLLLCGLCGLDSYRVVPGEQRLYGNTVVEIQPVRLVRDRNLEQPRLVLRPMLVEQST